MNINGKQVLAIIVAVLSVLAVSTAQLTDIIGAGPAKTVVSLAGLANTIMSSVLAVLTSQSSILTDAQAMPGVDKIVVNEQANKTLATLALDPLNDKIEAKPESVAAVTNTATGNGGAG